MSFMRGLIHSAGSQRAADRTRSCGEDGQALVETALMICLFMMLMVGFVQVAIIYNSQIMLTQAVGNGATYLTSLASTPGNVTDPCAATISNVGSSTPNLIASHLTVNVSLGGGATTTTCTLAQLQAVTTVQVNGNYTCSLAIPGVSSTGCHVVANQPMAVPPLTNN